MESIRLGVVGPGLIWKRAHKPALAGLADQVRIAAFSASSEKTRREVEQSFPGAPFFFDYHELAASPEVDWLLVLTPIALNAPVALAALRAGKDVFLEKPMARTLEEGAELVRVANETGRRIFVLEQFVYRPLVGQAEAVIRSGEIGDLVMFDQVAHEIFDATPEHSVGGYGATAWRINPDFPLGTLFDGGHHPIALLSRLFGKPNSVYASGYRVRPTYGQFDQVLTHFEYDNGFRGVLSHAGYLGGERNYCHIRGTKGLIALERGRMTVQPYGGTPRVVESAENDYAAMWRALLDAATSGAEPYYTKEMAYRELSILYAIHRSTQEGMKVSL